MLWKRYGVVIAMTAVLIAVPAPAEAIGPIEDALNRYHACTLAAQAMMLTQPVAGSIKLGWCQVGLMQDVRVIFDECLDSLGPSYRFFWIGKTTENPRDGQIFVPTLPPSVPPSEIATHPWGGYYFHFRCW